MKHLYIFYGIIVSVLFVSGLQNVAADTIYSTDTIILKFKNNVEVVVITGNGDDLSSAYNYDLNKIFKNLEYKIDRDEDGTITLVVEDEYGTRYLKDTIVVVKNTYSESSYDSDSRKRKNRYHKRTRSLYNIDIGMNNYLKEDGTFPDESNELYTVRPWGSWYIGLAFLFKTNVAGPFNLEWGGGIDWYNFKYQNSRTRMDKDDLGVNFFEDVTPNISPIKSKLSATYLNLRFIPVFDFSKSDSWGRDRLWNENIGNGFRIGFGPYVGYRIDSWTKYTYREEGTKKKNHNKDNYYLNNVRYGVRVQVGFRGIDLFGTYDLNSLYTENKDTPNLNAFTFGFTL